MRINRDDYSPSFLVMSGFVSGLFFTANEYKESAHVLSQSPCHPKTYTVHLLASLSVELYLKCLLAFIICEKYTGDFTTSVNNINCEIEKSIAQYGHDLKKLIDDIPNIQTDLGITSFTDCKNGRIDQYEVERGTDFFIIKSLMAVRYGLYSKNKDNGIIAVYDEILLKFLDDLEQYVNDKQTQVYHTLLAGMNKSY